MALSKTAVKNSIRAVLDSNMSNENAENSRDALAEALADAVCNAVKDGIESSLYSAGLLAPPGTAGGPVTGVINLSLTIAP